MCENRREKMTLNKPAALSRDSDSLKGLAWNEDNLILSLPNCKIQRAKRWGGAKLILIISVHLRLPMRRIWGGKWVIL